MENPLIQDLRDMLAFSESLKNGAMVITTQESVRAVLAELELLRATPGGATEIHVLDNGSHVTGERAANLLDDEMASHKRTIHELVQAETELVGLRRQVAAMSAQADAGRDEK